MPVFRGQRQTIRGGANGEYGFGNALAKGIESMVYAKSPDQQSSDTKPDEAGLLPSDHIVEQIGRNLEESGFKRVPHGVTNVRGVTNVGPYDKNDPLNIFRNNILNYGTEKD